MKPSPDMPPDPRPQRQGRADDGTLVDGADARNSSKLSSSMLRFRDSLRRAVSPKKSSRGDKIYSQHGSEDEVDWKAVNMAAKPWYLLNSNGSYKMKWDLVIVFFLLIIAFYVPFRVAFVDFSPYENELPPFWAIFDLLTFVAFSIDIILNFISVEVPEEPDVEMETRLRMIAWRYMKGFFIIDFFATFPFEWVASGEILPSSQSVDDDEMEEETHSSLYMGAKLTRLPRLLRIMKIMRLLRLLRVPKLQDYLHHIEATFKFHSGITRLLNIVFGVLLFNHGVACAWFGIGASSQHSACGDDDAAASADANFDENVHCSWIIHNSMNDRDMGTQYIAALYWAFSTLTTVGYGDISGHTVGERTFAMCMMLIGCGWYAYVVSTLSSVIASFDTQRQKRQSKLKSVDAFIRTNHLPDGIAKRIRRHFNAETVNRFLVDSQDSTQKIFREMSSDLRHEVNEKILAAVRQDTDARYPLAFSRSFAMWNVGSLRGFPC